MEITLTHLRQNLFALADEVVRTGEALVIERRGVRLKLVREDAAPAAIGRLQRLRSQELTVGGPLAPAESPAAWGGEVRSEMLMLAEPEASEPVAGKPAKARKRR